MTDNSAKSIEMAFSLMGIQNIQAATGWIVLSSKANLHKFNPLIHDIKEFTQEKWLDYSRFESIKFPQVKIHHPAENTYFELDQDLKELCRQGKNLGLHFQEDEWEVLKCEYQNRQFFR